MNRRFITAVVLLGIAAVAAVRIVHLNALSAGQAVGVALVYQNADSASMRAWNEALREAGISYEWIGERDAGLLDPRYLRSRFRVVIFPDRLARVVPDNIATTMQSYVEDGGILLVVDDAGSQNVLTRDFRDPASFTAVVGLNYVRYGELRKRAFGRSPVTFASQRIANAWHVPIGKLERNAISSYHYGPLTYPVPATEVTASDVAVDASSTFGPVVTERNLGLGEAFYVGLPLGYLRAHSDGFPLQIAIDRVIIDAGSTPHLAASPRARGAVVINWHIDSNSEWLGIPHLQQAGLLRPDLRYNFDVTAGPDRDRTGDGQGFDACHAGAPYLRTIERYGTIGSHGGWLHNGFAWDVIGHRLDFAHMKALIARNDDCLAKMTGKPVRDYAAPDGAHPQPEMTRAIEQLGMIGYYYTGDTGSAAELSLSDGALDSHNVWAFPIQPYGSYASLAEMRRGSVSPDRVSLWLNSIADNAARDRSVLLFYSHAYDMQYTPYDAPFSRFLDRLSYLQRTGGVQVDVMSDAAAFLSRRLATTFSFTRTGDRVEVALHNEQGLRDIAFALPHAWTPSTATLPRDVRNGRPDDRFAYYWVDGNEKTVDWNYTVGRVR